MRAGIYSVVVVLDSPACLQGLALLEEQEASGQSVQSLAEIETAVLAAARNKEQCASVGRVVSSLSSQYYRLQFNSSKATGLDILRRHGTIFAQRQSVSAKQPRGRSFCKHSS